MPAPIATSRFAGRGLKVRSLLRSYPDVIPAVTIWMSVLVALIVAFQIFTVRDEAQPAGTSQAFSVQEIRTESKAEAVAVIQSVASSMQCNIYKVQPSSTNSNSARTLYAFVGDVQLFDRNGGYHYPTFSQQLNRTIVRSSTDITTQDLRGRYVLELQSDAMAELLSRLEKGGVLAQESSLSGWGIAAFGLTQGHLLGPIAIVVVSLVLVIANATTRNRKVHAIKRLHGYSSARILVAEAWQLTRIFLFSAASAALLATIFLAAYNQLAQFSEFAGQVGVVWGFLYVTLLAVLVGAYVFLPRLNIPAVLAGERATRRNAVLAAMTQVAVMAILVATTSAALGRIDNLQDFSRVENHWREGQPLYALRLSVQSTHADDMADAPGLFEVFSQMEQSGSMLMAGYKGGAQSIPEIPPQAPEGDASLIVNNAFLAREAIRDDQGRVIEGLPEENNQFTLLVPASYGGDTEALLDDYVEYFHTFACVVGREDEDYSCDPEGHVARTMPGQDVFIFNGTYFLPAEMQERLTLHDPVVAVVSTRSGLVSPMEYLSYMSRDDVLVADPDGVDRALMSAGIRDIVQGIDNAADAVDASIDISRRELFIDTFSLAFGWLAIALAVSVGVAVYCDRRKRQLFVEYIHGYTFLKRHGSFIALAALLSSAGVAIAGTLGGSDVGVRELAAAGTALCLQVALAVIAVRYYERKFRGDMIKRY